MDEAPPPAAMLADFTGFSHFVASRQGLYVAGPDRVALFAAGSYFGLTLRAGALFAFEHRDRADAPTQTGRILRFALGRTGTAEVIAAGLGNGCHQIDFIGGALHIVDTYAQQLLVLEGDGVKVQHTSLSPIARTSGAPGYVHMNSITARGGTIYLMLHHGGARPSEILMLDPQWRESGRIASSGHSCHNIVVLEDGELLSCGSATGRLISNRGLTQPIIPGLMTRGLSVDANGIAVGSSIFGPRAIRKDLPGVVTFLGRGYRALGHVALPGSPADIRRIDGDDLSLANYAEACGAAI